MRSPASALLLALHTVAAAGPLPPGVPTTVLFLGGPVTGVSAPGVSYFLGIPFAATTAGANSFAAPQPRAPWATPLNGTAFGPGCLQSHNDSDVPRMLSADCLNLNVFVPPGGAGSLPVMVFFNGGAFVEGSDQGPFGMYSGARLAAFDVVVVAANYRLSAFGWLGGLGSAGITGNYGLMDQIAALRWVRDNIAAVGGDPRQVTLFGESAGAMSIGALLTSPRASGLFHRVIMESNVAGYNYKNQSEAAVYAATFCSHPALNCSGVSGGVSVGGGVCSADCLRAAPAAAVLTAWDAAASSIADFVLADLGHVLDGVLGTGPVLDGDILPREPLSAVAAGDYWGRLLPVLLGSNTNEGETFVYDGLGVPLPPFLVPLVYAAALGFNSTAAALVDAQPRYNSSAFPDGRTPLSHFVTDMWFRCASERFLAGAHTSGAAAYAYRFDHLYSNASAFPTFGLRICATSVCHASELPFVFHERPSAAYTPFSPEEEALAARMGGYWTDFAKGIAPGGGAWPLWEPTTRLSLVLNTTEAVESTVGLCGFWDSLQGAYFW